MILNKKILRSIGLPVLFSLVSAFIALIISHIPLLYQIELKSLDLRFRLRDVRAPVDSSIVIVALDDQTFATIGQKWPYPRTFFAKLIRNLGEAGARLIVMDVEFTEPSADPSQDDSLAQAAREVGKVIFCGKVVEEIGAYGTRNRYPFKPIPPLIKSGCPWGIANMAEDPDGFVRHYLLYDRLGDRRYYSLGVRALQLLFDVPDEAIQETADYLTVGPVAIRKASANTMLINYLGPTRTFPTYSFVDVLDDFSFDLGDADTDIFELYKIWGTFRDKIVLVGATAEELHDIKQTPFYIYYTEEGLARRGMPGVEIHANALHTMLTNDYLLRMPRTLEIGMVLLFTLIVGALLFGLKPLVGAAVCLVLYLGFLFAGWQLFAQYRLWIPWLSPGVALGFNLLSGVLYQYVGERRKKMRYLKIFQHYVSDKIVKRMVETEEYPKFGGEKKRLTVLFSDIRDFSRFSEQNAPEKVVQMLSEYLTAMVEVIFRHDGTLDKFVGDEIMALFGAPYHYENHAEKACQAALDMVAQLREFQAHYSRQGQSYFRIGIGINTGEMVVGNLGSRQLFDYTVIGDAVNLGARLEGTNKLYKTTIIISEFTFQEVADKAICRELDRIRVKGREHPVTIYELRGMGRIPDIEQEFLIEIYHRALKLFRESRWYEALKEFHRILRYFPSDGPTNLYIRRCLDAIENPLAFDSSEAVSLPFK